MSVEEHELLAVSPLDGRYARSVDALRPLTSEFGLIGYRVEVEIEWLRMLGGGDVLPDVQPLDEDQDNFLRSLADNFSVEDAKRIKEIESKTRHDVKSVEIWIKEKLEEAGGFEEYAELTHFGCTSEDINNLAYAMMIRDVREKVLFPAIDAIGLDLEDKTHEYADIALLGETHGQPATPTTLGKEMGVFVERIARTREKLGAVAIHGKFNGATGTFGAHYQAYPDVDWRAVNKRFVESMGFEYTEVTTQIEPHDYTARFLSELALVSTQLIGMSKDFWEYISKGIYAQPAVEGEVGSSTMPHKVNPIDFENAEANFGVSSALARHLAEKLPQSRRQRDLSDSAAQRYLGTVFGASVVALASLKRGLGKVSPDRARISQILDNEWAILAEPLQMVMRRHNVAGAYDIIKDQTRGKEMTQQDYLAIVNGLDIPKEDKQRLIDLTPATYTGKAAEIAKSIIYPYGK